MLHRDKQVSKYKDQVENLKEQLYNCEADLEKASSALESSKSVLTVVCICMNPLQMTMYMFMNSYKCLS